MKLGDMTLKQIAKICDSHTCITCPFATPTGRCWFRVEAAENWDIDVEVNTDAEN